MTASTPTLLSADGRELFGSRIHITSGCTIAVWSIGDLVFDDFIHDNPYRPRSDALIQIALLTLRGLFGALMISELWLGGATILALASHRIWGRVPFGSMVMLPICGSLLYLQGQVVLAPGLTRILDFRLPHAVLPGDAAMQLPILIGCWWCERSLCAATKVTG